MSEPDSPTAPEFSGTYQEFRMFLGPLLRNVVNQITRLPKATAGACQHCGDTGTLDAAHVHGHGRWTIVERILGVQSRSDRIRVDLNDLIRDFKAAHEPIESAILFLCKACHREYDSHPLRGSGSGTGQSHSGALPITLDPEHPDDFRRAILSSRLAVIDVTFTDGRIESRQWRADRLSPNSNVLGNLRSRPEFRRNEWRRRGIVGIHVRVASA